MVVKYVVAGVAANIFGPTDNPVPPNGIPVLLGLVALIGNAGL